MKRKSKIKIKKYRLKLTQFRNFFKMLRMVSIIIGKKKKHTQLEESTILVKEILILKMLRLLIKSEKF